MIPVVVSNLNLVFIMKEVVIHYFEEKKKEMHNTTDLIRAGVNSSSVKIINNDDHYLFWSRSCQGLFRV
jgi:hypothetical protein